MRDEISVRAAARKASVQRVVIDSTPSAHFSKRKALFSNDYQAARSSVIRLLSFARPSTVGWLVVSIVVDAFQRVATRPLSKIAYELREAVLPAIAHGNTSTAVVLPRCRFRIKASVFHRQPDLVFGCLLATVNSGHLLNGLALQTAAASCVTCSQGSRVDDAFGTAVATAVPSRAARCRGGKHEGRQASEPLAGEIEERRHRKSLHRMTDVYVGGIHVADLLRAAGYEAVATP